MTDLEYARKRKEFIFQMPGQMVIVSFMLRFVKEKSEDEAAGAVNQWRIYVRHIQGGKEQYFATLQAAFGFLEGYLANDEAGEEALETLGGVFNADAKSHPG